MTLEDFMEKIKSMADDDIRVAESDRRPQQNTIYHYTNVKAALGILGSGKLWFTERAHLNDTAEMRYGLRVARELFDDTAKMRNPPVPKVEGFRFSETHERRLTQFGYWVFCASLNDDDLGQWQQYADDGRGVCLGFSLEKLESMFRLPDIKQRLPHVHHARHFCVSYCARKLRANMQRYIDCALDVLGTLDLPPKNSATLTDEEGAFFFLNGGIYLHAMLHKHQAYHREKEYRFLISGEHGKFANYECHRVRERNREIVEFLELPIPAWKPQGINGGPLTQIRIGPAAPDRLKDQIWRATRSFGIPGLHIDKSDIPYRSD